jgi:acyl-coenzyme A synthetase/AMP-(fatty) acid ligase
MSALPLIHHAGNDTVFAYRGGRPIVAGEFLAAAAALAAALPDRGHMVNLCTDRYRFAVGFAAAMMRGQISLLLPNKTPTLLAQIAARYADAYCLSDDTAIADCPLPAIAYPNGLAPAAGPHPVPSIPATQIAALVFTSGSTGMPQPNVKSWGALVRSSRAAGAGLGIAKYPSAVLLGTVPAQHMFGFESTILLGLQHGLALHAEQPFYPADIGAALGALPRPRILVTTPVHLRALLADGDAVPPADFVLCATAPLAPQVAAAAEARFAAPLYEIYGCSEAGQVASRRTTASEEWRCLDGITLRQDERGSWAAGGSSEAPILLNDIIELRGEGLFLLHGRIADLVNIAGKRTSLAHLNFHLNSIPGVRDGVFVMPPEDGEGVTRLTAFVVAPGLAREAILAALRQHIDAVFLPRPLHIVASLPRNSTGKLPREAIDKLAAEFAER